jgi:hypothetical protein
MMNRFEQHATGTTGRIVDRFPLAWIQNVDHQADNGTRRIEFSCFFVRGIGEALDQVLVRLAEYVRFCCGVS